LYHLSQTHSSLIERQSRQDGVTSLRRLNIQSLIVGDLLRGFSISRLRLLLCVIFLIRSRLLPNLLEFQAAPALMVEAKLSSIRMTEEASLQSQYQKPSSTILRAGPSLIPSAVTETVSSRILRRLTKIRLSSGEEGEGPEGWEG
jgi:hypothetical protein